MQSKNIFLYLFTVIISYLFFTHTDATYTLAISNSLNIGHVADFYDYNAKQIGFASYLPTIYALMASWNEPLVWFGLIDPLKIQAWAIDYPKVKMSFYEYFIFVGWYKLLLIIFAIGTANYIKKISNHFSPKTGNESYIFFITSPFTLFSILIFSGYDIFAVFFSTAGFYYYLRKDLLKFSLLFSIAITCKFFPLVIFFPLLLLSEKKFFPIIKYSAISVFTSLFLILIYTKNVTLLSSIFHVANDKLISGKLSYLKLAALIGYLLLCLRCYVSEKHNSQSHIKKSISAAYAGYCLLFFAIKWHPQWILILMPFTVLSWHFIKNKKLIFFVEGLGFLSFILLTTNIWKDNVDQKMITQGPISKILPDVQVQIAEFLDVSHFKTIVIVIFYIYLLHPLWASKMNLFNKVTASHILKLRFIFLYFFIIPAFLCVLNSTLIPFTPKPLANKQVYEKSIKCIYNQCESNE
jgi:hypothetical protein